jgi:hypothetical protein
MGKSPPCGNGSTGSLNADLPQVNSSNMLPHDLANPISCAPYRISLGEDLSD